MREKIAKNLWVLVVAAFLFSTIRAAFSSNNITLELGVFVGSNWDVANANSYVIIDNAIEKFTSKYPNVNIQYYSGIPKDEYSEWMARKILKGEMPDVFMVLTEDFDKFSSLGIMKDLDELMIRDKDFSSDKFFSTPFNSGKYLGTQYALPFETVPTLMFVNKTLLKNEGISVPGLDWTWNDLYNICSRITKDKNGDGTPDQFATYGYDWRNAINTNNATLFNEEGTKAYFTDEPVVDSVRFAKKISDLTGGQKVSQSDFDRGNVAFMPLQFSDYRTYKTYPYKIKKYTNFQWDCITMPAGKNGDNISEVSTLLMGISSYTKQEKLAWEFLKQLTYDESVQMDIFRYSQGASVLKSVTDSKEAETIIQEYMEEGDIVIDSKMLSTVIEKGVNRPKFAKYQEAMALADNEISKIIEGNKNADTTLKLLQRNLNKFLKQ